MGNINQSGGVLAAYTMVESVIPPSLADFFTQVEDGRIKCKLSGHVLPPNGVEVSRYAEGKRFTKLRREAEETAAIKSLEPHIVPSVNLPGMLFCCLTGTVFNRRLTDAQRHVGGGKYQRALVRFKQGKLEVFREPTEEEIREERDRERDGDGDDDEGRSDGMPMECNGVMMDGTLTLEEEDEGGRIASRIPSSVLQKGDKKRKSESGGPKQTKRRSQLRKRTKAK